MTDVACDEAIDLVSCSCFSPFILVMPSVCIECWLYSLFNFSVSVLRICNGNAR